MMTMEAELRALKDELSNRGSSMASNTSSQATLKEKEEVHEKPDASVDTTEVPNNNKIEQNDDEIDEAKFETEENT